MDASQQFLRKLHESVADGFFIRLRLTGPVPAMAGAKPPQSIQVRPVLLKAGPRFSFTFKYPTRDEVKNLDQATALAQIEQRLSEYTAAYLWTTQGDWQLQTAGAQKRLVAHPAKVKEVPPTTHDEAKETWLDDSAQDWLHGLGITTAEGKIAANMADKHRQIARYVEILAHLAKDLGWGPPQPPKPLALADMGCGKGYLTFAAWHLFGRRWQWPARVLGLELRPELVGTANLLARRINANGLEFQAGTIASANLPSLDALIALHACDTATDDALLQGIQAGAGLIVVAPCCHKELRPQLGTPEPLAPILRHGLMAGRMAEWLTDGLRALYLEWAGYDTRMIEFVASEHTPRNLMIAAVRKHPPFADDAARNRIVELKSFFGIQHHALDELLNCTSRTDEAMANGAL